MLIIFVLAIKAAAISCWDGHFDRVGNVAELSTEASNVNLLHQRDTKYNLRTAKACRWYESSRIPTLFN
jgi:hypothetical protein